MPFNSAHHLQYYIQHPLFVRKSAKVLIFATVLQAIANEIAADELAHVIFLRTALGASAVPMPLVCSHSPPLILSNPPDIYFYIMNI